eukprot:13162828-Alexandrium_andersonii.AAC.1
MGGRVRLGEGDVPGERGVGRARRAHTLTSTCNDPYGDMKGEQLSHVVGGLGDTQRLTVGE